MKTGMRTLIDLKEEEIVALDEQAKREGVSRAALMRRAIAEFLDRLRPLKADAGFGAWKRVDAAADGLAYQQKLRREW